MKRLFVLAVLIATPALAQAITHPQQPTRQQVQEAYLIETGQLRQELGHALRQLDAANAQIAALRAKLDAEKTQSQQKKK